LKIRPVVYIVPLVILAVAVATGSSLLLRVFTLLAVVGLVGLFWTWVGARGLSAEVGDTPAYCHAGDTFKEELTIANQSRLPKLLLQVEEDTDLPGYRNARVMKLAAQDRQAWLTAVKCRRRGRYHFGAVSATAGDPFGLFSQTRRLGKPATIMVYPQIVELPYFRTSFSSLIDFGHGASGRRISQISPSASSVREMVNGDSQEHIHWRSTAHTGKLMVKTFDAEHSSDNSKNVWIVLDLQKQAHYEQADETSEDYCVTAATSLARKYLDDGLRVGLIAHGDREYSFPPNAGAPHFMKMLESMALMRATGDIPVERVTADADRFSGNSTVVVVTPQSTEVVVNALRHLKNYGHSVVAVFVDSSSFGGPVSPDHVAQSLGTIGAQVYVVRRGEDIARALDSRAALWYSRYV
jgi:uncharacterized protein (DUF58 family)